MSGKSEKSRNSGKSEKSENTEKFEKLIKKKGQDEE